VDELQQASDGYLQPQAGDGGLQTAEAAPRPQHVAVAERVSLYTASGLLSGGLIAAYVATRSVGVLLVAVAWPFLFPFLSALGQAAQERLTPLVAERFVSGVESYFQSALRVKDRVVHFPDKGSAWSGTIVGKRDARWFLVRRDMDGNIWKVQRRSLAKLETLMQTAEAMRADGKAASAPRSPSAG
jgi:hypothetical protein